MEPRRKGEGREDGRPIEGPFGAQEGELAHVSWRKAMRRFRPACARRSPVCAENLIRVGGVRELAILAAC